MVLTMNTNTNLHDASDIGRDNRLYVLGDFDRRLTISFGKTEHAVQRQRELKADSEVGGFLSAQSPFRASIAWFWRNWFVFVMVGILLAMPAAITFLLIAEQAGSVPVSVGCFGANNTMSSGR